MRLRLRHLRFAPAVAFALLALALFGMWVRSYKTVDVPNYTASGNFAFRIVSHRGIVAVVLRTSQSWEQGGWMLNHFPTVPRGDYWKRTSWGFGFNQDRNSRQLYIPYYSLVLVSVSVSALLTFKPITRFTVRGLLIATTLLAVVLGLAVYAV